mgnify:CR=1 FL=1
MNGIGHEGAREGPFSSIYRATGHCGWGRDRPNVQGKASSIVYYREHLQII